MDTNLIEEAKAFDRQILERIANGHIPDLRAAEKCEYFYNNPWRHPEYIKLDIYEQFELINDAIKTYVSTENRCPRILEVGCGPGHLTLELAREGYDVSGIDLSPVCIQIAQSFADADPWKDERGKLQYIAGDFLNQRILEGWRGYFDAVIFLGALHHFPNQDMVIKKVKAVLANKGIVIAHEPTRDRVTRGNAAFMNLIRVLLSAGGGFFEDIPIPNTKNEANAEFEKIYRQMKYENENQGKVQSINDNEAGHKEMCAALSANFQELVYQERYAFFHEVIGGLRFSEDKNIALARYLRDIDKYLCELGVLQSTEFFFAGRKHL